MKRGAWKKWASALKKNVYALYLASQDPEVPLPAKVIIGLVVAYALSPVDVIPDFIPVIGYIDDLILLPIGIWLAIKLIPKDIWRECQVLAQEQVFELPRSFPAGAVIIVIWFLAITGFVWWVWPFLAGTKNS